MHRRDVLRGLAVGGAFTTFGFSAYTAPVGWREFEITYRVKLDTRQTPARLWLPVPQDALDYQRVVDIAWRSPAAVSLQWEGRSRAPVVAATWTDPGIAREIEVTARVQTRDRSGFYPDASHDELAEYLRPTASSPSDGIVLKMPRRVAVALAISPLCLKPATWVANAPTSIRCLSDWRGPPACRHAISSGCASRIRR